MRPLLRLANVLQWPIWLRIGVVVLITVLLPTFIGFLLIEQEVRRVDRENLVAFLEDHGQERREDLIDSFNEARQDLSTFIQSEDQRGYLLRLMSFDSRVPDVLNSLQTTMDVDLVGSGRFEEVRLVSAEGEILLDSQSDLLGQAAGESQVGEVQPAAPAHRAFRNAVDLGQDQRWTLFEDDAGMLQIELIQIVRNAEGPIGYIAGRLNQQTTIFTILDAEEAFINTASYLVTGDGRVIAASEDAGYAQQSETANPVVGPVSLRSRINEVVVDGEEVLSFVAPIVETPFTLVMETPIQINFVQTLDRVYDEAFLLIFAMAGIGLVMGGLVTQTISPPLAGLRRSIADLSNGDFASPVPAVERGDGIGQLARTFVAVREQIRSLVEDQASVIQQRVRDLQATQEVTRYAAAEREPQALMDNVVQLIVDLFPNIYHAQIFLIDADQQYAVLRASTGEAGKLLLSRGHRLGVGSVSVIGQVTEEARVVVARDTSESEVHRLNEFLPETRAELAIPLMIGETVIGALDVQSKKNDSFTEDQINILRTMADQIAIAIENTRLYQESVRRLEEVTEANRKVMRRAWKDHLTYERQRSMVSEAGASQAEGDLSLREQALQTGEPAVGEPTPQDTIPFAVPISLRGQTLGVVDWEVPAQDFSYDKVQLARELVNRLAVSLDNARLFQESQRAISRERLVNEIASKLTGQTDIDEILQTAVREVGQALRAPQVAINLALTGDHQTPNGDNDGNES